MQNVSGKQTGTMDTRGLSILVIDEDEIRASIIRQGLFEVGYDDVSLISVMHGLVQVVERLAPDVIVIDLANPSRDLVEHLSRVSSAVRRRGDDIRIAGRQRIMAGQA
jgi:response regulator NasT